MKFNYPIKYALYPIYDFQEDEENLTCYIACKCYLIESITSYNKYGEEIKYYNIIFLYKNTDKGWIRVEPEISSYNRDKIIVKEIYDTFEEAKDAAKKNNEELKIEKNAEIKNMYNKYNINLEDYDLCKREQEIFKKRIDNYYNIQEILEEYTKSLKQSTSSNKCIIIQDFKTDNPLVKQDNNIDLYEYLRIFYFLFNNGTSPLKVFHVSEKNMESMMQEITKLNNIEQPNEKYKLLIKKWLNLYTNQPLIQSNPNDTENFIVKNQNNLQVYTLNNETLQKYEGQKNIKDETNPEEIIFTTETFEDILQSYPPYYNIEGKETKILKKKKF